jgi:hypothetical protein
VSGILLVDRGMNIVQLLGHDLPQAGDGFVLLRVVGNEL